MKQCSKCKLEKPLEEFGKKKNSLQSWCRSCNTLYQQQWYMANREKHKTGVRVSAARIKANMRKWMFAYFADKACVDCGNTDYRVFQFDHVQGVKHTEVSDMIRRGYALEKIISEIAKCEIRCANCHTIKTGYSANWWWTKV